MEIMTDAAAPHQPDGPLPFTSFEPGTHAPREAEELLEASVGPVVAEVVHLEKSRAESIKGSRVTMRRSAAQRVEAGSLQMVNSAAASARTDDLAVHDSAVAALSTNEARVENSVILAMRAKHVTGEGRNAILLNVGPAGDNATTLLSGQSALRLGAGLALTLLVFGRVFRLIFGRSR